MLKKKKPEHGDKHVGTRKERKHKKAATLTTVECVSESPPRGTPAW